ncbi:hypothetical protein POSPLADRAFT_1041213 [Postia placenta MAD-698-R-SB12]|uniref:Uncharacterized protein n=1 Tax=Postia placenta MAD-698-R-SB12 TaxID=670580 RepID=A0A1X6MRI3_9APHY|nr:hypothetical protein POSPLADRAFT_1041213 [Postia placenta MAD-698-R-SB12]OSX58994.1 hypothetical protein POSPLADRAFT_1041213 [Postia placenta MAD-698-R-SB12]
MCDSLTNYLGYLILPMSRCSACRSTTFVVQVRTIQQYATATQLHTREHEGLKGPDHLGQ